MSLVRCLLVLLFIPGLLSACPFCTTQKPTLSQRREQAGVVAIAECLEISADAATFRVHQVPQGAQRLSPKNAERLTIARDAAIRPGGLAILFADAADDKLSWTYEPANEFGLGYFAQAPSMRVTTADRLRYFVRFLEHSDRLAAEDAFNEFGYAPYDAVCQVADLFSVDALRRWLVDPNVPDERKGFYGLALGLAGRTHDPAAQEAFLRQQIEQPASDFRAGFDGLLGGYMVLKGEEGLALIESRFLTNLEARTGDVRHAMSALRFYQEFGREIPLPRLARAMRHLLARPEHAAAAVIDLARWQDWQAREQIVALYRAEPPPAASTRRAIVGYLLNCPLPQAAEDLATLRRLDPAGVSEVEKSLQSGGGLLVN